ncbi:FAD-dependent oxidoreductase [Jeotgalibacillus haloalkalitolerans]|uniref:FAD-dependent oxidoreductase n=1 Tax=Jeotgalibacillus haloalkalitolerans TaxID=3104292 RepID=A0ABU5KR44_9BACL|nr:FAD-dependent oxidoreductase [Jeotgalibacillus sp. HH7-29]MDZ5713563.1 FAD-dependent oxidoreductase [Jeotgalibacillus sp. HH7-29]
MKKLMIIGSVAAGTSVGAKARRNSEDIQITIYDRDTDISYSGCGIPYYVGGEVADLDDLTPRNAAWFKKRYNIDIHTQHEVESINHQEKTAVIRNLITNETFMDSYDTLVLATGATSFVPPISGVEAENVFSVRNIRNAGEIRNYVDTHLPKTATIVGGGFIGLEMAEQLTQRGIEVTLVERLPQIMPPLDQDMAARVAEHLEEKNVSVMTGETVKSLQGGKRITSVLLESGQAVETDLVILSVGIRPNTELAKEIGVEIGSTGAIKVNRKMQTNVPNVYAVGDVAESFSLITGKPIYRPLGSTANKTGRIAGQVITGEDTEHRGILGTGIFKVFDLAVAQTGLTEKDAVEEGYTIEVLHNIKPDRPEYLGGKEMVIKAVADRRTGKLLGAQIVGPQGVDKRIDVFVTAISFGAKAEDLFHLDLAYAPPFATTKDPVMYTGMALHNAFNEKAPLITPQQLIRETESGEAFQIIDTRSKAQFEKAHVKGAIHIPLGDLRNRASELNRDLKTVVYCNKGVTGNAAQNILINHGFKQVYNLSGGNKNYQHVVKNF